MTGPILRRLWTRMSTAWKTFYFLSYEQDMSGMAFASFPQPADSRTTGRFPRCASLNTNVLAALVASAPCAFARAMQETYFRNQSFRFRSWRARTEWVACSTTRRERWLRGRTKRMQVIDFSCGPVPRTTRYFCVRDVAPEIKAEYSSQPNFTGRRGTTFSLISHSGGDT